QIPAFDVLIDVGHSFAQCFDDLGRVHARDYRLRPPRRWPGIPRCSWRRLESQYCTLLPRKAQVRARSPAIAHADSERMPEVGRPLRIRSSRARRYHERRFAWTLVFTRVTNLRLKSLVFRRERRNDPLLGLVHFLDEAGLMLLDEVRREIEL